MLDLVGNVIYYYMLLIFLAGFNNIINLTQWVQWVKQKGHGEVRAHRPYQETKLLRFDSWSKYRHMVIWAKLTLLRGYTVGNILI